MRVQPVFAALIGVWVATTCVSSLAGGAFVQATGDCLTPALLSLAATAALRIGRRSPLSPPTGSSSMAGASQQHHQQQAHQAGHQAWLLALGVLQLLSSVLTLASFGLSSVPFTFIVRTLEPLCSYVLVCLLQQRNCSLRELLLLGAVAGSTCCVLRGAGQPGSAVDAQPRGGAGATALAIVSTLTISCRSVASKAVASLTESSEYDNFLQAATPGLLAGAVLQLALWVLFGAMPLRGLLAAGWSTGATNALLACVVFNCVNGAVSVKVLQQCTPVMHGVLNVVKRVAILVIAALLFGQPLTPLQLLGVLAANGAAAALSLQQSAAATAGGQGVSPGTPRCSVGTATAEVVLPPLCTRTAADKAGLIWQQGSSWCGGSARTERLLTRLVYMIASVLMCGAVCLAYVVASGLQQQVAQQQQRLPEPVQHGGGSSGWLPNIRADNSSSNVHSSSTAASAAVAQAFVSRDIQRIRCLTDLHNASKASLAPFLANRTSGGVALFDVALHKNLGDAMLWAAAARLVPEFHQALRYVCALSQFPGGKGQEARALFPKCSVAAMLKALGPGGVVLLAPGGNWGDLWWFVHSQRLQYLREMGAAVKQGGQPLFQVVQLPQSLTFSSADKKQRDKQTVAALPRGMLTLFARQAESLAYARRQYGGSATVLQAPDLAFSLGPLMSSSEPVVDVLFLMRQDKEAAASETAAVAAAARKAAPAAGRTSNRTGAGRGNRTTKAAPPPRDAASRAEAAKALRQLQALGLSYEMREWEFAHANFSREVSRAALTQLGESRLQGAVDVVSRAKVVVTNRLHAAVMANLLGRPLVWIDTQQRKLSGVRALAFSYSPACTEANLHSRQAGSFAEAVRMAAELLRAPGFVWSVQQLSEDSFPRGRG